MKNCKIEVTLYWIGDLKIRQQENSEIYKLHWGWEKQRITNHFVNIIFNKFIYIRIESRDIES